MFIVANTDLYNSCQAAFIDGLFLQNYRIEVVVRVYIFIRCVDPTFQKESANPFVALYKVPNGT